MTMYDNCYYVMQEGNGQFSCLQSYSDIEKAKQHAKRISADLNTTCLVVKPIFKVISHTEWIIEDLRRITNE